MHSFCYLDRQCSLQIDIILGCLENVLNVKGISRLYAQKNPCISGYYVNDIDIL